MIYSNHLLLHTNSLNEYNFFTKHVRSQLEFDNPNYSDCPFDNPKIIKYYTKITPTLIAVPREMFPIKRLKEKFFVEDNSIWNENEQFKVEEKITLRNYQAEPYEKIINDKARILFMKTGGGKTEILLKAVCHWKRKTCVIVNTDYLSGQWLERIKKRTSLNAEIGNAKYVKSLKEIKSDIFIITTQSLMNLCYEKFKWFYDTFSVVIFDEVHLHGAEKFIKNISKFKASKRLGCSASAVRNDNMPIFKLHLGKEYFSKYETPVPTIQIIDKTYFGVGGLKYPRLLDFLSICDKYHLDVIEDLKELYKTRKNILILAHRIEHIKNLFEKFPEKAKEKSVLIYGKVQKKEKDKINDDTKFIFATFSLFKQAVDLPKFNTLLLLTPFANKVDIEQSVGRILRQRTDNQKPYIREYRIINNYSSTQLYNKKINWYKQFRYDLKYKKTGRSHLELEV